MSGQYTLPQVKIGFIDPATVRSRVADAWRNGLSSAVNTSANIASRPNSVPQQVAMGSGQAANASAAQTSNNMRDLQPGQSGGLANVPGQQGFTSDEEQKKDIQEQSNNVKGMLDNLKAYSYRYKDPSQPGTNKDENLGIMAQDLEKSKMGKQAVFEAPHGKMIDTNKTVSLAMAALANLNKRINKLEKK